MDASTLVLIIQPLWSGKKITRRLGPYASVEGCCQPSIKFGGVLEEDSKKTAAAVARVMRDLVGDQSELGQFVNCEVCHV